MDLLFIFRVLKRNLWVLIGIPIAAVICAFFLVSRLEKVYKSSAQLATGFTADEVVGLDEDRRVSQYEVNSKFTNLVESMNSYPVISLLSYRLVLHDLESETPFRAFKVDEEVSSIYDTAKFNFARKAFREKLSNFKSLNLYDQNDKILADILKGYRYDVESLEEKLSIKRLGASDYITVDFSSENPFLSAYAVNALSQEFMRFNRSIKTDRSSESIDFLENLVQEKKTALEQKTKQLNDFKVANNVFNYGAESQGKIAQITQYELNKEQEEKKISALELSLSSLESQISNYSVKSDKQEIIQINQRIIELRRKINDLSASDGNNERRLAELRDELQLETSRLSMLSNESSDQSDLKELERQRESARLELQIARSNLSMINESLNRLKYDVTGFATKEATLSDLEREVKVASDEYLAAQDNLNAKRNKAMAVGSTLRQTLEGQPSDKPEPSKAIVLMGLAGVGSFTLCVIVLVLIEYMDFSIKVPSKLERQTGLKTIGALNAISTKAFNLHKIFNDQNGDPDSGMFVHFLRKLRFEIQNSNGKTFLITSTQVNVGKSFLIISLSYTLTLMNKRVLIIDTNFKHNSLTRLLLPKIDNSRLLKRAPLDETNLIEEWPLHTDKNGQSAKNGAEEGGKSIIYKTDFNGVDIIGNSGVTDSPAEILAGRNFHNMINSLSEQYDYILLEGPSLNDYSDTKELIEYVDKVIPVFSADTVLKSLDFESIKYLKSIKDKLIGSVLNKVQAKDLSI